VQEGRSAKFGIGKPVLFFGVRTELTYLALRAAANRSVTRKTRCPAALRVRGLACVSQSLLLRLRAEKLPAL
jgi:hypothetical protein